jgi:hypothetical protein
VITGGALLWQPVSLGPAARISSTQLCPDGAARERPVVQIDVKAGSPAMMASNS